MGIRIHKMIGYGLTDVKSDKENWKIIDERFNPDSSFIKYDYEEQEDILQADKYIKFIKSKIKKTKYKADGKIEKLDSDEIDVFLEHNLLQMRYEDKNSTLYTKSKSIDFCFEYDMEFGMSNVMLFIPPGHGNDWHRYDDTIDYYEFYNEYDEGDKSRFVREIPGGIYPYNGIYCDKRNGKRLDNVSIRNYHSLKNEKVKASFKKTNEMKLYRKHLTESAKKLGFKNVKEADENINPLVADSVVAFCEYLDVFKDINTVYQLKPLIYVVWR